MTGKRKEFHNNWQRFKDAPDEMFESHEFEDLMSWRVDHWELPSSVFCLIRESNTKTGKVKEHVYQRPGFAFKKILSLQKKSDTEFLVCDAAGLYGNLQPPIQNDEPTDD